MSYRKNFSLERERELIDAWQTRQDIKARNKIILAYMPLNKKLAGKYAKATKDGFEDLLGEGSIALMKALDTYRSSEAAFGTWATFYIRGAMTGYVTRNISCLTTTDGNRQKRLFPKILRERQSLDGDSFLQGDIDRIAEKYDLTPIQVTDAVRAIESGVSLDDQPVFANKVIDERTAEAIFGESEETDYRRSLLKEALMSLTPRRRQIMEMHLRNDAPSDKALSLELGVCQQAISQLRMLSIKAIRVYVKTHTA